MKLFKGGAIFLFLIIFSISAYADTIISDSFDYGDAYTSHTWGFSTPYAEFPNSPISSYFSTNAFGFSGKSEAGSIYGAGIYRNLGGINSGQVYLSYNFYLGNNSINANSPIRNTLYIKGADTNYRFYIDLKPTGAGTNITAFYFDSPNTINICGQQISASTSNIAGSIVAQFDLGTNLLNLYFNGSVLGDCLSKNFNPNSIDINMSQFLIEVDIDTNEYITAMVDDIFLSTTGVNTTRSIIGEPCQINEDCQSGRCEYGACILKQSGTPCISSSECASGDCHNGLCTKPTLSQNLDLAMSENFGSDARTKNMVSLFLMIGVPAVITIMSGGAGIGVLLALACFFVEGFAFTYFGWLSPFILIGIVIVALIVVVFAFIIKANG